MFRIGAVNNIFVCDSELKQRIVNVITMRRGAHTPRQQCTNRAGEPVGEWGWGNLISGAPTSESLCVHTSGIHQAARRTAESFDKTSKRVRLEGIHCMKGACCLRTDTWRAHLSWAFCVAHPQRPHRKLLEFGSKSKQLTADFAKRPPRVQVRVHREPAEKRDCGERHSNRVAALPPEILCNGRVVAQARPDEEVLARAVGANLVHACVKPHLVVGRLHPLSDEFVPVNSVMVGQASWSDN
jgi:hypothetical protein